MINIYCTMALANIYSYKFAKPKIITQDRGIVMIKAEEILPHPGQNGFVCLRVGDKTLPVNTNHIIAYEKVDDQTIPAAGSKIKLVGA